MSTLSGTASACGLLLGYAADQVFGDPRRYHPVAGFGRLATAWEERIYADRRAAGVAYVLVLVGGSVALGAWVDRLTRRRPVWRVLTTAAATWAVLGGRSLRREAGRVAAQLAAGDLPAARDQIRSLVGRDPTDFGAEELARACVESVAENTSDAVVAPLLCGAVGGVAGLIGYRAVNTLDAMVGHRSARYRQFGWAAARLDDAANWVPARLAGALAICSARVVDGSSRAAWRTVRRDAGAHPSPNAGVVEAAFAGALGVRLGGTNVYEGRVEDRGTLGDGRSLQLSDIARACRLALVVSLATAGLAVAARALTGVSR